LLRVSRKKCEMKIKYVPRIRRVTEMHLGITFVFIFDDIIVIRERYVSDIGRVLTYKKDLTSEDERDHLTRRYPSLGRTNEDKLCIRY